MTTSRTSKAAVSPSPLELAKQTLALAAGLKADVEAYVQFGRTVTV